MVKEFFIAKFQGFFRILIESEFRGFSDGFDEFMVEAVRSKKCTVSILRFFANVSTFRKNYTINQLSSHLFPQNAPHSHTALKYYAQRYSVRKVTFFSFQNKINDFDIKT